MPGRRPKRQYPPVRDGDRGTTGPGGRRCIDRSALAEDAASTARRPQAALRGGPKSSGMAAFINFEDEEEVRGYLENMHIEYSYQCFKEKDPDGKRHRREPRAAAPGLAAASSPSRCLAGCQRLADYLDAVKKDFVAAGRVLRDNCEAHGHSESCYKLGAYQAIGKGGLGFASAHSPGARLSGLQSPPVAAEYRGVAGSSSAARRTPSVVVLSAGSGAWLMPVGKQLSPLQRC